MSLAAMVRYEFLRVGLSAVHRAGFVLAVLVSVLGCLSYLVLLRQLATAGGPAVAAEAAQLALGKGSVVHLYAGLHGAVAVASELGSGRAAQLLAADQRRGRWLAAKAGVAGACALAAQAVAAVVCVPLLGAFGGPEALGSPGVVTAVLLANAVDALLWVGYGIGVGVVMHGSSWTAPAVLAVPVALGQFFRAVEAYTGAPGWVPALNPFGGADLLRTPLPLDAPLVLVAGGGLDATVLYFAAFALGAGLMGARIFRTRDVHV
jgi:hypothetical protein